MEHISGAELKTISGQCQGTNGGLSPGLPDHLAVGLAESSIGGGDDLQSADQVPVHFIFSGTHRIQNHRWAQGLWWESGRKSRMEMGRYQINVSFSIFHRYTPFTY